MKKLFGAAAILVLLAGAPVAAQTAAAKVAKGADGKCRYTTGPKKGQFAKCP